MYRWVGWFDGSEDCEPPEPGKFWIEIQDEDFNEVCVIVHRTEEFNQTSDSVLSKEKMAQHIVDALMLHEAHIFGGIDARS